MPLFIHAAATFVVLQVANTLATEVLTAPGQEVAVVATNQVRLPQLLPAFFLTTHVVLLPCVGKRSSRVRSRLTLVDCYVQ
jgi:hypothetical protein